MKDRVRSYLVFATRGYKIVMLIVLPIFLLAVDFIAAVVFRGSAMPAYIMLLIMAEVMSDNWYLGGIQEKNSQKIDYLKTSARGRQIMKSALIMDLVRRLVFLVVIAGVSWLFTIIFTAGEGVRAKPGLWEVLLVALLVYTLSLLGIFLCRFFSYLWVNLLAAYVGAIVGVVIFLIAAGGFLPVLLMDAVLGILGAGLSVLAVKTAMLKVEGSYYDK